jgi:hypothetical protein
VNNYLNGFKMLNKISNWMMAIKLAVVLWWESLFDDHDDDWPGSYGVAV